MATLGNTKKRTEEEATAAEAHELGNLAFLQTLPPEAVITDEGVYSSHTQMIVEQRRREEEAAAAESNDNKGGSS